MLQRCGKAAADHIPQHVKDHHVGVFQQVMLLEQLHGLPGDVATAAGARWRAAGFHAHHPVEAFKDEVVGLQLLAVEVHLFEDVDHRWHHLVGQGEGAVVLGIATDLKHPFAQLGKRSREIR